MLNKALLGLLSFSLLAGCDHKSDPAETVDSSPAMLAGHVIASQPLVRSTAQPVAEAAMTMMHLLVSNEDPVNLDGYIDNAGQLQIRHDNDNLVDYGQEIWCEHDTNTSITVKIYDFTVGSVTWQVSAVCMAVRRGPARATTCGSRSPKSRARRSRSRSRRPTARAPSSGRS
jgi:hypothetical protein